MSAGFGTGWGALLPIAAEGEGARTGGEARVAAAAAAAGTVSRQAHWQVTTKQ
jgi:hypothetical protein